MYIFYHTKILFPFFETIIQKQQDFFIQYLKKTVFYFYKEPISYDYQCRFLNNS